MDANFHLNVRFQLLRNRNFYLITSYMFSFYPRSSREVLALRATHFSASIIICNRQFWEVSVCMTHVRQTNTYCVDPQLVNGGYNRAGITADCVGMNVLLLLHNFPIRSDITNTSIVAASNATNGSLECKKIALQWHLSIWLQMSALTLVR